MSTLPMQDVTAVIAAYNAERSVAASIQSIKQVIGCPVIVVDDGSTDDTAAIARAAGAVVIEQANAGAAAARLAGAEATASTFVILLDSDDQLLSGMRDAVAAIKSDERIAVVGGRIELSNSRGPTGKKGPELAVSYGTQDLLMAPNSPFPPSAAVWRRDLLLASNRIPHPLMRTKYAEDFETLIRASVVGVIRTVPVTTCLYTAFGGKSTLAAFEAIGCAESIRTTYASRLGFDTSKATAKDLQDIATWRVFRSRQVEFGFFGALRWATRDLERLTTVVRLGLVKALRQMQAISDRRVSPSQETGRA
jgi:glycosyltransferase involved in cell wall biosynthesis